MTKIYFLLINSQMISSYVWFFLPREASLSFSFLLICILVISLFSSTIVAIVSMDKYINFSYIFTIVTMVTIDILLGIIVLILTVFIVKQYKDANKMKKQITELNSLTKSQQVKYGKSFEHFVPFINNFPANRETTVFLGMPLDFIAFEEDSIKFIEVKTGVSELSSKQKRIKKLIEDKKVEFHELRY